MQSFARGRCMLQACARQRVQGSGVGGAVNLKQQHKPMSGAGFKTKTSKLRTTMAASVGAAGSSAGFGAGMGVLAWMQQHPFAAQTTIATVKTSLADLLVQKQVEKREQVDWRRNALFILFGGAYLGVFQWFVYVRGFQKLFPAMDKFCNQSLRDKIRNKEGIKALFGQIGLDFFFVQPFLYFPVFYAFKTVVEEDLGGKTRWEHAMQNWRKNFLADNFGMCAFWFPMDLIIYSVPLWLRLPLNHAISFAWCCVLSVFRGAEEEGQAPDERK